MIYRTFHSVTESFANGQSSLVKKKKYSRERNNTNKAGTSLGPGAADKS